MVWSGLDPASAAHPTRGPNALERRGLWSGLCFIHNPKVLGTPRHDVDSTLVADVRGIDMVFDTTTVAAGGVTGFFREK